MRDLLFYFIIYGDTRAGEIRIWQAATLWCRNGQYCLCATEVGYQGEREGRLPQELALELSLALWPVLSACLWGQLKLYGCPPDQDFYHVGGQSDRWIVFLWEGHMCVCGGGGGGLPSLVCKLCFIKTLVVFQVIVWGHCWRRLICLNNDKELYVTINYKLQTLDYKNSQWALELWIWVF